MVSQNLRQSFKLNSLPVQIIAGCGFGLMLGVVCLRFSVLLAFGILVTVLLIYATLKRPEIALVGILIATSSIVFEEQLPLVFLGGISLHISDILLLGLLGLIGVRWVAKPGFKIVRTPLDRPLLIFYGVTLLSTLIAIAQSSVDVVDARRAMRVLSYYLTFFIVTNLVRELRQLNFLLRSLYFLATIVATAMVVQFLLGDSIRLLPGRVESLATQGTLYEGITRILPPGWSIILVSFVCILCVLILEKIRLQGTLRFMQLGLLGMALLVTFLRSYWAALFIVFILLAYIVKGEERRMFVRWGLVAIFSVAMILIIIFVDTGSRAARLIDASLDRLSTLGRSGTFRGEDSSLDWRKIENRYALSTISSHPLIGLGMGAKYRPRDSKLDQRTPRGYTADLRGLIHNGHLGILLQSGLLGYLSLMWLSFVFLRRGFRYWRDVVSDRLRGVVLGITLTYLIVLIAAVANSTFMQWRWTPVLGIMMGINEAILREFGHEDSDA